MRDLEVLAQRVHATGGKMTAQRTLIYRALDGDTSHPTAPRRSTATAHNAAPVPTHHRTMWRHTGPDPQADGHRPVSGDLREGAFMSETAKTTANRRLVEALQRNWQAEMEGAATYRALAEREKDAHRRSVLLKLAEAEVRHAQRWEHRLHELGAPIPTYTGSPTGQAESLANRTGGPESALRRVERGEREHIAVYSRQLQELNDEPST